jgi:integrase
MAARRRFGRIRQLPSGRWQARYPGPDDRDRPAPATFATKTAAARFLAQVEADLTRGTWSDPNAGDVPLSEWAKTFLTTTTALKPKTRAGYQSLVRTTITPALGRTPVNRIRAIDVSVWLAALTTRGLSSSRIRQSYRLLSQMLNAAQASGLIVANPCLAVRPPRLTETQPQIITRGDVARLADVMTPPYDVFVLLLAYTGIRFGEACALRRQSVNVTNKLLQVTESLSDVNGVLTFEAPKNHQRRSVALPTFLVELLEKRLADVPDREDALLFTSPNGAPVRHPNFMCRHWQPAVKAIGLTGLTPHDLRASHASWLVDDGWSVLDVAARLGHSQASVTTRHYARPMPGRDRDLADRLDEMHTNSTLPLEGRAEGATLKLPGQISRLGGRERGRLGKPELHTCNFKVNALTLNSWRPLP